MPAFASIDFLFVPTKLASIDIHTPNLLVLAQSGKSDPTATATPLGVVRPALPKFRFFRRSALLFAAADALLFLGLVGAVGSPLDLSLARWTVGAVLLGTPASFLVDHVAKVSSFRSAFLVEAALTSFAFAWLSGGFVVLANVSFVHAAPLLYWPAFTESVLAMSVMGTACFCLISTSVLSLLLADSSSSPSLA